MRLVEIGATLQQPGPRAICVDGVFAGEADGHAVIGVFRGLLGEPVPIADRIGNQDALGIHA